jgi:hypothetical protein
LEIAHFGEKNMLPNKKRRIQKGRGELVSMLQVPLMSAV